METCGKPDFINFEPRHRTGIAGSHFCLGTMTWGSQNSEAEAHGPMNRAVERSDASVKLAETEAAWLEASEAYEGAVGG
ncbi:hypothetical protein [Notoacmeibacter marinus]|nr:hypothetical protein [Notoacmeibacter marinus]